MPPAALAVTLRLLHDKRSGRRDLTIRPLMRILPAAVAFAAPLLLYAYLPGEAQPGPDAGPTDGGRADEDVVEGEFSEN